MGDRITYVGLDVHKEGIVVAVAEGGMRGEVREYGRIAFERRECRTRWSHQGRQRRRPPAVDRGGLGLPLSGPDQPAAAAAPGGAIHSDPRHCLESAAAAVCALSQAGAHRQADQARHGGNRPRTGGLRVGDRSVGAAGGLIGKHS